MKVNKEKISGIIKNTAILRIPFFQRKYVWKEEMWEEFLESMRSVSQKNGNDQDDYFMGSIILKEIDNGFGMNDIGLVIDGQQRLITTFLFFKALCKQQKMEAFFDSRFYVSEGKKNGTSKKIGLEPSIKDKNIFNDIINEKIENIENDSYIKKNENEIYNSKIYQCYKFFMKEDLSTIDIEAVNKYICFVLVELKGKEDEQQVFDTINNLGVKLTTAELVKNHLFNNQTGEEEYNKYWVKTFEGDRTSFWDRNITSGRQHKDNIEVFFQAFFSLYNKKSTSKDYTKLGSLHKKYKKFLNDEGILNNTEKREKFLDDLTSYGNLYFNEIKSESLEEPLSMGSAMQRINIIIFALNTTTIIPYILYILKSIHDKEEKHKMLSLIESFVMRRFICKFSAKKYNEIFALLHKKGDSAEALKKWMDESIGINEPTSGVPSDTKLHESFQNFNPDNKTAKVILYFIESHLHSEENIIPLRPFRNYSLEHIMPKKWETHWPLPYNAENFQEIERKNKINFLGNMTIIPQSLNPRLSNKNWHDKKTGTNGYEGLEQCARGVKSFDDKEKKYLESKGWNENIIDDRTKYLADLSVKIWGENVTRQK